MMAVEILPVDLEKKKAIIESIRSTYIPKLISRDYHSERVLHILHRIGTMFAKPASLEQEITDKKTSAFFAGINPIPNNLEQLDKLLNEKQHTQEGGYTQWGYYLKGNYRILGCFSPNPDLEDDCPETGTYFTAAVPVSTRDYHIEQSPFYYPPIINIHKTMSQISTNFDNRFPNAESPEEVANTVAPFYFWGLVMTHPFIGGNHRAYDRFIEYAFAAKGYDLKVPQNETANIPNDDPFNIALYQERRVFLERMGLKAERMNLCNPESISNYLKYQHQLNEALHYGIGTNLFDGNKIADSILKWK